ncbi:MAG: alpha/beta fold hydrolase [Planctomycetota bacterium]|jgi:esterase/lipase/1-acyl-sn-glycerol-3-phosphate acyltransferase
MSLTAYNATSLSMSVLKRVLGLKLRVSGIENLDPRTTLFVANHFTRAETFLIPHVIFEYAGRQVRSLGTHSVFKGLFGRYFEALGGMSTRHPRRNRTIIRELMTGRSDWIIYPEGGLIKNKKMVHRGRLRLTHPERHGPPHTGAAMLALKAQMAKRRYLAACAEDDLRRIDYYEDCYNLPGPEHVCNHDIVISPVTLTFYPMRPSRNLLNRLATFFVRELDPRIDEELQVEGSMLFKGAEICVHFGEPLEVADYLGGVSNLARRFVGLFSEANRGDVFLRQRAKRLTEECMRTIYGNLEVNFDHLFSYGLRAHDGDRIAVDDLRAALYLAAVELAAAEGVRLHPSMGNGITSLVTGEPYPPWESAVRLATREGVLKRDNEHFTVDRAALDEEHGFHDIRLHKMMQVIANELEPVRAAVEAVRRNIRLSADEIRTRTSQALRDREELVYERDYAGAFDPQESKDKDLGEPFFLEARGATTGVVLAHGYLASPQQVRPLAEYLHGAGISVYVVRLPGHGTAPDQLTKVRWEDWLDCLARGCGLVRQHCQRVIVGGFSLGGALALVLAARLGERVDGVFCINAPVKLRDRRAPLVGPLVRWHGAMRLLGLADGDYRLSNEGTESPDINYGIDYLRGIREVRRAGRACLRALGDVTAPALIIQADADPIVSPAGGRLLLARLGSQDKVLTTLPFDRHLIVRDAGAEAVFSLVARFAKRLAEAYSSAASRPG